MYLVTIKYKFFDFLANKSQYLLNLLYKDKMNSAEMKKTLALSIFLLILFIAFSFLSKEFLTTQNLSTLLRQHSVMLLLTLAVSFPILVGGLDISIGSVIGLISMVTAMGVIKGGVLFGIMCSLVVGICIGAINGIISEKFKISPFIVTLGMMNASRGIALQLNEGRPVVGLPPDLIALYTSSFGPIPVPWLVALSLLVLSYLILSKIKLGWHFYAVGGNEEAAYINGINVFSVRVLAYVFCGLLTCIAGILMTSRINIGHPTLGTGLELEAIAAAVIGGVLIGGGYGKIFGIFQGALVLSVFSNGLNLAGVSPYIQNLAIGTVLIITLILNRKK